MQTKSPQIEMMPELAPKPKVLVNHMIIHELAKEQMKSEAEVYASAELSTIDKQSISLLEILINRYSSGKENIRYGKFSDDENKSFPREFRVYVNAPSEESFLNMTTTTLQNLKEIVKNIPASKGGYFIFADYRSNSESFFAVFLIRNTEGKLITRNPSTNSYQINSTEHLDLEKVAMGCRISKENYLKTEGRYLSFTRKNQDFSNYFINWIAAEELVDNTIYTEALLEIGNKISLPKDMTREKLKKTIYDVTKASPNSTLRLATLDEILFNGEGKIHEFIEDNQILIDAEFEPVSKIMKKFIQIAVHEENIKLEFGYDDLNTKVVVREDTITITCKKLADSIRKDSGDQ
jgi:nucleoid-associated protein